MVKEMEVNKRALYVCEACGFAYEQKEWAQKCQEWCEEHNSCNLDIIKHGVPLEAD